MAGKANSVESRIENAKALLKEAGYTVLHAPPIEIGATHRLTAQDLSMFRAPGDVTAHVARALAARLGTEILPHALVTKNEDAHNYSAEYTAVLHVVVRKDARGMASV